MKGGYKILDLKGTNFTIDGDEIKVDGLYHAIESSYGKLLVIENYSLGGVEKNDRALSVGVDDGNFVSIVGFDADLTKGLYIKVTPADMVSFYNA